MKICVLSDTHGYFPTIPDCDLLLLGGDYCPVVKGQQWWFRDKFAPWLADLSKRMKIIGVAGNHDLLFEQKPELVPKMEWEYLQDSGTEFGGLKIWGSPWQRRFFDWAFNASEEELAAKWRRIPEDTDIFLLHGPPRGYGDFTFSGESVGSPTLTATIKEIKPKLVVFGHIHPGAGIYDLDGSILVNASYVNESYMATYEPRVIEL